MEYQAFFLEDTAILGQVRHFRVVKLAEESPAAILRGEDGAEFLLGDMRVLAPGEKLGLAVAEQAALGCAETDVVAFCRVRIPQEAPQEAGFDTGRLILLDPASGRAVEAERTGRPLLSLKR